MQAYYRALYQGDDPKAHSMNFIEWHKVSLVYSLTISKPKPVKLRHFVVLPKRTT